MRNRIFAISFTLSVSLTCSLLPGNGIAADACHSILAGGFYSQYPRIAPPQRDQALYAELCSLDYSKADSIIKRVQSSDRVAGLRYGLINLDDVEPEGEPKKGGTPAAPRVSGERFSQWQSGYCSQYSAEPSSQAAEFFMQRAARGNAGLMKSVEAWSACMRKQEGLSCWASPHDAQAGDVLLNVNWTDGTGQSQPEVQYSYLNRGGVSKFKGAEARRILPDGSRLGAGTLQIPITRPEDKGVFATLTVNQGGKEHSCKVFLPDEKDFPLIEPFVNRLKLRYPG